MRPTPAPLLVLAFLAVASCDRADSGVAITSPQRSATFSTSPAPAASASTLLPIWGRQRTSAALALVSPGSPPAATTGEAEGNVWLSGVSVGTERYTFGAASGRRERDSRDQLSFDAVGHVEFRTELGMVGSGEIDCLTIAGSTARITARWTRATFQGQPVTIPDGQHLIWVVQDLGNHGAANDRSPDMASEVYQTPPDHVSELCRTVVLPMQPIDRGEVHVRASNAELADQHEP